MPAKAVKEKAEERVVTEDTVQPVETAPGVTTDPATAGTQIDASSNNNQQRDTTPDNSSKSDSTPSTTPTTPDTEKPSTNPDMDVEPDQEPATENNGNAEGTETQEATEQVMP